MKKLIVSFKPTSDVLNDFKRALKKAHTGNFKKHFEVSFDDRKDFNKFIKNIDVLICIQTMKPDSVYHLAKLMKKDQSNLNKILNLFESYGVIHFDKTTRENRSLKRPIVGYDKIEFDLKAS